MQGRIQTGAGMKINGIIKEYQVEAGGNVNAGDFVKFIQRAGDTWQTIQLSNEQNTGSYMSGTLIDDTRAFVAFSYGTSYQLYAVVVDFSGDVSVGTVTLLSGGQWAGLYTVSMTIRENTVTVFYASNNNDAYLNYSICEINGTTITIKVARTLINTTKTGADVTGIYLGNNQILLVHGSGTNYTLAYTFCAVNGDNITVDNTGDITTTRNTQYGANIVRIDENKVVVFFENQSVTKYTGQATVGVIDGNNLIMQAGTTVFSNSGGSVRRINSTRISSNKVFATANNDSGMMLALCTINENNTITVVNEADTRYRGDGAYPLVMSSDEIYLFCGTKSGAYLTLLKINIEGSSIVTGDARLLGGSVIMKSFATKASNVLAIFNVNALTNGRLRVTFTGLSSTIKRVETEYDTILGVSKTKGAETQMVKVYVPNV